MTLSGVCVEKKIITRLAVLLKKNGENTRDVYRKPSANSFIVTTDVQTQNANELRVFVVINLFHQFFVSALLLVNRR